MLTHLKQIRRAGLVVVLLALIGAIIPAQAQELTDLRFFLSFIPNIQFSPLYVAAAKGYFADEGYNLIIEHGDENIGVEQIAVGTIPFGMISGEQVILARANGRPVVYVYEWFNKYPVGIVIPNTTPATTVAELAGRKVGVPGRFGANYSGLIALLGVNAMVETDVQLEVIGYNAPDVLCVGAVEAAAVYVNNEPLQILNRAAAGDCGDITSLTVIPVADSSNMVANGIVTSEEVVANNPALVTAVNRAFDRGLRDAIQNPAEAYQISLDYVENLPASDEFQAALQTAAVAQTAFLAEAPERDAITTSRADLLTSLREQGFTPDDLIQFEVLLATIDLWDDEHLGFTDESTWTRTQDVLLTIGAISEPIDLTAAFTNDYLPLMSEANE